MSSGYIFKLHSSIPFLSTGVFCGKKVIGQVSFCRSMIIWWTDLAVPKYKLQTYGLNAFSVAALTLPSHIRNSKSLNVFKKHVKTFLFLLVRRLRTGLPGFGAL